MPRDEAKAVLPDDAPERHPLAVRVITTRPLRSCPFCLGEPTVEQDQLDRFTIFCEVEGCGINPQSEPQTTLEQALAVWNHRWYPFYRSPEESGIQ